MNPLWLSLLLPTVATAQETSASPPPESLPGSAPTSPSSQKPQTDRVPINRHFGIQIDVGGSTFIGDLTDETFAPTYDFQLKFMYLQSKRRPLYTYLSVNTLWTDVIHTGDQFIHNPGAKVEILSFMYVATLCGNPNYQHLHVCFGLGEGTVNTNSEGNRQDLGTWNYHGQIQYDVAPRASVMLSAKFIGRLEQQVDHVSSQFSFASVMLGPQYVF